MRNRRATHWALLPDDVLTVLGEADSLGGASRRIQSEMRQWGLDRADGFVISHESVLMRESPDGIVWTEMLTPWLISVAFGEEAQASTADRLSAGMALMSTHFLGHSQNEFLGKMAQEVVSDILLEHPVLLHPRLIAPLFQQGKGVVEQMPVIAALLATKGGTLPSASHVADHSKLQEFASSALAAAPFNRMAPKKAWVASPILGREKHAILGGKPLTTAKSYGTPTPGFVASLLELSRLRGGDPNIIAPDGRGDSDLFRMVHEALPSAFGLHRYNLGTSGIASVERCEPMLREVREGGFAKMAKVQSGLAEALMERIVMRPWSFPTKAGCATPALVEENCKAALSGLAEVRVAESVQAAARWLVDGSLRSGRNGLGLPETTVEAAIAVFGALGAAGLTPEQMEPVDLAPRDASTMFATWRSAHEIYSRQAVMESVLVGQADTSNGLAPPPRRRRLGM